MYIPDRTEFLLFQLWQGDPVSFVDEIYTIRKSGISNPPMHSLVVRVQKPRYRSLLTSRTVSVSNQRAHFSGDHSGLTASGSQSRSSPRHSRASKSGPLDQDRSRSRSRSTSQTTSRIVLHPRCVISPGKSDGELSATSGEESEGNKKSGQNRDKFASRK